MDWLLVILTLGILVVAVIVSTRFYFLIKPINIARPPNPPTKTGEIKNALYDRIEPFALITRIALQAVIGTGLAFLVILKFSHHLVDLINNTAPNPNANDILSNYVYNLSTLDIVGYALAYATAIELAYALFTDDLDEAVTPLITGLAATILIIISRPSFKLDISGGIGIAIAVLALAGLFSIKIWLVSRKPPTSPTP